METQIFASPYISDVHFRGKLQHRGHVGEQKIKCQPIRARQISGLWLQDELYEVDHIPSNFLKAVFQKFYLVHP